MSKDYVKKTKEFVKELEKEKVYKDYIYYKKMLSQDEELYKQMFEYASKRFEIQANSVYGSYNSYNNLIDLQREYEEFLAEPLVQNYLKAELNYSKLLRSVFDIISNSVQMDLEFLQ